MECPDMLPPSSVRGMTLLDRERFKKIVQIPKLDVTEVSLKSIIPHIKRMLLKIQRHKSIELGSDGTKKLLLHPTSITCFGDLPEEVRNLGLNGSHLKWEEFELKYENWSTEDILKAVLPADQESCTSYSRIGHIIHVNLKTHLLPYKQLIGEVFRDKISGIRCVINKIQTIDNTFRNFSLELLSGEEDYQVEVKENGTNFKFDFSQVYWNPRLATEHERIIKMHDKGDVLYDVFAGVGPFSIPVAKRKAFVMANDLNPSSFKWLQYNMKKNKVTNFMQTINKDGRDFILEDVKCDLIKRWNSCGSKLYKIHLTMNLPAMAVEFLDTFCGLMLGYAGPIDPLPLVHVYCFAKGDEPAIIAKGLVEENLGYKLGTNLQGVNFVRNVAPNKDMFRVSFFLTRDILCMKKNGSKRGITPEFGAEFSCKKSCNTMK
ncbi:tRNA (guanine(37)-N1)-methyltransferase [Sitodiplosis mosellana]|uniref:tRNA (guanine(37)-N1)-methyltransferase n=1 Tax=Sitodiplosis mosellana TaxID=263140 RepID=UPI0024438AA5|nr:tRNA (guanine(37)-N1)-methyltransferase [Sitodiplosis mosellana]